MKAEEFCKLTEDFFYIQLFHNMKKSAEDGHTNYTIYRNERNLHPLYNLTEKQEKHLVNLGYKVTREIEEKEYRNCSNKIKEPFLFFFTREVTQVILEIEKFEKITISACCGENEK